MQARLASLPFGENGGQTESRIWPSGAGAGDPGRRKTKPKNLRASVGLIVLVVRGGQSPSLF